MASDNTSIPSTSLVKHPDILMSVGVVGILMVMLVPLPRFFLDLLLSFNITLSIIILLVGMQVRRPLEFSVFPSILLMVTLLRLSSRSRKNRGSGTSMTIKMPTTPTDIRISGCLTSDVLGIEVFSDAIATPTTQNYAGGNLPRTRYTKARISATARYRSSGTSRPTSTSLYRVRATNLFSTIMTPC